MKQIIQTTLLCSLALVLFTACSAKAPDMGMTNGKFAACTADDEDCISSQSNDMAYSIAPFKADGDPEIVMVDLAKSVESIFGGKVITMKDNYLRAEFRGSVMRTMDDVEFFYDQEAKLIHIHAVSRDELMDFDDNRDRLEELRVLFAQTQ